MLVTGVNDEDRNSSVLLVWGYEFCSQVGGHYFVNIRGANGNKPE